MGRKRIKPEINEKFNSLIFIEEFEPDVLKWAFHIKKIE